MWIAKKTVEVLFPIPYSSFEPYLLLSFCYGNSSGMTGTHPVDDGYSRLRE